MNGKKTIRETGIFLFSLILLLSLFLAGCGDPKSDLAAINSFIFTAADNEALAADVTASIDGTAITATVPHGTNITSLAATVEASAAAVVTPDPAAAADYSSPVTFTVTAEDGETSAEYTVTVTEAPEPPEEASTEAVITSFSFTAADNTELSADAEGTITDTDITVTVPYGTDVTALVPSIAISEGAAVSPASGTAADFTSAVTYTVTAEDGETTAAYTVTVTVSPAPPSTEAAITSFSFTAADNTELSADAAGTITGTDIAVSVPYGTDVTALVPSIAISEGAAVSPTSGSAGDFSSPKMYTVTAEDEVHSASYLVTVTVEAFEETVNDFSSTPLQQLELTAREANDYLGGFLSSDFPNGQIAFSEDGTILVIGVPQLGNSPVDIGCAVVFEESGGTWTEAATLNGSLADVSDYMGSSVAISRDGSVIAVGAFFDEASGLTESGLVYVFVRSGSSWTDMSSETTRLNPSDRDHSDFFGSSVAVNTDGSVIAAGAWREDGNGAEEGSAYVFLRPEGGWDTEPVYEEAARLRMSASVGWDGSDLGQSIAISTDGSTVAAGAPGYARTLTNSGAVFVFTEPAEGWDAADPLPTEVNETAVLTTETEQSGTFLGRDISMTGDGSVIAAGGEGYNNQGAVFIYRSPGTWADASEDQLITAYNRLSADSFGRSVSLSGSGGYLVTGAPYRDPDDSDEGAFYLYELDGASYTAADPVYFTRMTLMNADSWFGRSLAISPDASTICVGAPGWDDTGLLNVGTALIYQ